MPKAVELSNLPALSASPLLVSPRPSKENLNKLKFHSKNKSVNTPN